MTPLSVRVEDLDARTTKQYAFIKSPVRVGRGELNDLQLDRPFVSTFHGVISFDGEQITFVDLGSTNGTLFNGQRLEPRKPVAVTEETELRVGPLRLHLSRTSTSKVMPAAAPTHGQTMFAMRAAQMPSPQEAFLPTNPQLRRAEAPPREPELPPAPASGPDRAKDAADAASWQLGVLYDAVKQSREHFETAVQSAMLGLSEEEQRRARALIRQQFPESAPSQPGAAAPVVPEISAGQGAATGLVSTFADSYIPGLSLDGADAVKKFLESIAELLESSIKSFLELRKGYDEFGREMGIRVPRGEGAVARVKDARALLKYLLEPTTTGEPRARELSSAFADLMIHQVALLRGITEGAKDLLMQISPEAIDEALRKEGGGGLSMGISALREGALWRAFVDKHRELSDDESAVTAALFGKAFAQAYSAVAGRRITTGEEGRSDETPPPSRARRDA